MRVKLSATATALALILAACGETSAPQQGANPEAGAETTETAAADEAEIQAETARLNAWFDEKYEEQVMMSPIQLTFLGRKERNDEIDDMSYEAAQEQLQWRLDTLAEMEANFDYDKLTPEAKNSWDIWKYQTEQAEEGMQYFYNGFTFDQMNGAQSFLPTILIQFHRVDNEADMEAYISRISEGARAGNQLLEIAKESASRGVETPDFALEGVIDQSRKVITGAPFTDGEPSDLWADVQMEISNLQEAGEIDEARAEELMTAAETALTEDFQPAYENLIAWAESEFEDAPENPTGLTSQPGGAEYYNYRLKVSTTTDLTADEIHEIGLEEVERLQGEMEAVKEEFGFDGTLQEFFVYLRENTDDRELYYENTDEGADQYIADATAAIDNIEGQLPEYFGILPKADLIVKRVEPFREQDGAAQHYYPGTPDGSRPGTYYAHLSDMNAMPKRELEVIAYHEGLPGHHMQISIAQELQDIPQFRTQAGFTAYSEGWGLYSERLASEMPGTFQTPQSEFGRLGSEIWRAIRLVVDTGLHSKGWTEQEAWEYFTENAAVTDQQARSEIQRYIVMPGQATAYKIGMIKILELREMAREELGDDFDIRGFHDTILGGGALPLELLERRVNTWIEDVKAGEAGMADTTEVETETETMDVEE
ncbi:MAG TPA: DUF885 domain-containing protein [Henriciella marina]|uniref:DUF885 domain-containing protein n=1 Tax=Henriciella sp. TaxID=1968823 RepID=UPI00182B2BA4|nr:DUF885 domain-containing protein [Henriciella sp.]HIG22740.1 DUF885 domain-containing protein [Henriciella sp.]HIK65018.1 DUF885 domain-containing protein [Henriciella marina]